MASKTDIHSFLQRSKDCLHGSESQTLFQKNCWARSVRRSFNIVKSTGRDNLYGHQLQYGNIWVTFKFQIYLKNAGEFGTFWSSGSGFLENKNFKKFAKKRVQLLNHL